MRRRIAAIVVAPVVALGVARGGFAEVLINQNFNANSDYQYAYTYAGGGNPQTVRDNLTSSRAGYDAIGVDNTRAVYANADFSQLSTVPPFPDYNYSGFGLGIGHFRMDFPNNHPFGLPSANLADYRGHISLAALGLNSGTAPTEIQMQLQLPDDFFGTDADTNFTPFVQVAIPVQVSPDFRTFNFSLDQGTLTYNDAVPAAERDFAKHIQDIGLINVNFNVDNADGNQRFGLDGDNFLIADNVFLEVVPEPSSLALVGAGLCVGLMRRRARRA